MTTYLHAVSSLDGFIADDHDGVGPLHDWYFGGDHPIVNTDRPGDDNAPFRIPAASADYVKRYFGSFAEGPELLEDPDVVIPSDRVLHLRYPVRGH